MWVTIPVIRKKTISVSEEPKHTQYLPLNYIEFRSRYYKAKNSHGGTILYKLGLFSTSPLDIVDVILLLRRSALRVFSTA